MADRHPEFRHMHDIVTSVINSGTTALLAARTSMHDLLVVAEPIVEPPFDEVHVYSPSSAHPLLKPGSVVIEHVAVSGHNDCIQRPVTEAVPLFWRFMINKYGVAPVHPPG